MTNNNDSPIQRAIAKQNELRAAGLLNSRTPIQKFIDNPRIGRAVKTHCYQCQGYSRKDANECTSKSCPLWLFRKGKSSPDESETKEWRKHFSTFMDSVNELNKGKSNNPQSIINDDDDNDDIDTDTQENIDDDTEDDE